MNEPTLYRLLDIDSDDPEYGLGNRGTMYRGHVEPVEPDYESGVKTAARVMDELDNFEAAIVAGIAAALGR